MKIDEALRFETLIAWKRISCLVFLWEGVKLLPKVFVSLGFGSVVNFLCFDCQRELVVETGQIFGRGYVWWSLNDMESSSCSIRFFGRVPLH